MRFLFMLALAAVCFVVGVGVSAKRAWFLLGAERTNGSVSQLHASNSRCGSKNNKYDCTQYDASVSFSSADGKKGMISVSAGSARGYNQPESKASLAIGAPIPVIYNPSDIADAFHDSFAALWGFPLGSFVGSGFFGLAAIGRRRR